VTVTLHQKTAGLLGANSRAGSRAADGRQAVTGQEPSFDRLMNRTFERRLYLEASQLKAFNVALEARKRAGVGSRSSLSRRRASDSYEFSYRSLTTVH